MRRSSRRRGCTTRSAAARIRGSWVEKTKVIPRSRFRRFRRSITARPVVLVQRRGGLVREDDADVADQRPRDGHPLLLAAGHALGAPAGLVGDADRGQGLQGAAAPLGGGERTREQHVLDVLVRGQDRNEVEALEDERDPFPPQAGPLALAERRDVPAVQADRARVRRVEEAEEIEQRGLAGAGRTRDGQELPGVHVQVDVRERGHGLPVSAVAIGHRPHLIQTHGRPPRFCGRDGEAPHAAAREKQQGTGGDERAGRQQPGLASAERPQEQERGEGDGQIVQAVPGEGLHEREQQCQVERQEQRPGPAALRPEAQRHVRAREGGEEERRGPFQALLSPRPPEAVGAVACADQGGRGIGQGEGEDRDAEV